MTAAPLALGCNNFGPRLDADAARAVTIAALDAGITTFDTADVYGAGASEELLGRALAGQHDDVTVITKFGIRRGHGAHDADSSPDWVRTACDASLGRLGVERLDVYVQHRVDPLTPVAETVGALAELHRAGKIGACGFASLDVDQIDAFVAACRSHPELPLKGAQYEWSLLARDVERAVLPRLADHDIRVVPFFPLASGLLTGKYRRGAMPAGSRLADMEMFARFAADDLRARADRLADLAHEHGHSLLELALRWSVTRPGVQAVLVGATTPAQVRANAAAATADVAPDLLTAAGSVA